MRKHALQQASSFAGSRVICARCLKFRTASSSRRHVSVQAIASFQPTSNNDTNTLSSSATTPNASPDAQFEVLGHAYSLLSAKLSPSQNLYVRRGALVGVSGRPNDAISTLSAIGPIFRAALGIPFLYQRVSATSPITAHISTRSAATSFSIIHLDGRVDWIVAQRAGLLAWTGHTLSVSPKANLKMSVAHWGNSYVTGRGLMALVGKGQVFQINLKAGEQYVAHPGNVLAYTVSANPPLPYRFRSTTLRLQLPNVTSWLPENRFIRTMRESAAWRMTVQALFVLRTWLRRTVWGDRLFLQFQGPTTVLLQSRGSSVTDVLTNRDVNEIAEAPAGAVPEAVALDIETERQNAIAAAQQGGTPSPAAAQVPSKMRMATIRSGKVEIRDARA